MGEALVQKILPVVAKMKWPTVEDVTAHGSTSYEVGTEKVAGSQGNPKKLSEALRIFQGGNSAPYAYAGIAAVLLSAAREKDDSYSTNSLNTVMEWLEKAQAIAPDIIEINVIEGFVYIYGGNLDDARLVLDYLHDTESGNYYVYTAEAAYWIHMGDVEQTAVWTEKAAQRADTNPQRIRMRSQLADFYLKNNELDKALEAYKSGLSVDKENVTLWYKISIIYWKQKNLEECERSNRMTLRLRSNHSPALKLQAAIKKKKAESNKLGGIFGKR